MAVGYDSYGSQATITGATSQSWTHTPSGTPTAVYVMCITWGDPGAFSAATYGGSAMTQIVTDLKNTSLSPQRTNVWKYESPASGAQTVQLTWTNSVVKSGMSVAVTGSGSTGAPSTGVQNNSSSYSDTQTVSTGGMLLGFWTYDKASPSDFTLNDTAIAELNNGYWDFGANYITTSGSQTLDITLAASNNEHKAVFLVEPAGGASGPANLKSLDTNLKANIKSYNTNLIANVKSINTNA